MGVRQTASDSFARANGGLGSNWTATQGALAISSQTVAGTNASGYSGDMWSAQSFATDQYSQIQVSSTPLTGSQWIGPAVRAQNSGQSLYAGAYYWNQGKPELLLYKRISGTWTQLGSAYACGNVGGRHPAEADGRRQQSVVFGQRHRPGHGQRHQPHRGRPRHRGQRYRHGPELGRRQRRLPGHLSAHRPSGIQYYDILSDNNGYGVQTLRVLKPTHPAAGVAHNFLYVLPVEAASGDTDGDGLADAASDSMRRPVQRDDRRTDIH